MSSVGAGLIAVIAAVAVAAFVIFGRRSRPKERTFKCSRCSATAAHTPRTIEAWRAGKTKFFCNACHTQWVRSQPSRPQAGGGSHRGRAGNAGCLGIVVLLIALPTACAGLWWAYA